MISAIEQLIEKVSDYLDQQGFQKSHYYQTLLANCIYAAIDAEKNKGVISFRLDSVAEINSKLSSEFTSVFSNSNNKSSSWLLQCCEAASADVIIVFTENKVQKITFHGELLFDITRSERILSDLSEKLSLTFGKL